MSFLKRIIEFTEKNLPGKPSLENIHPQKSVRDFKSAIIRKKGKEVRLIGELKRKSPSRGEINLNMTVRDAWELYSPYAAALSVLTEPHFFGGSLKDLKEMDLLSKLPILRKDFILHPVQVKEARHYGADAYLLIVAALSQDQLKELMDAGREYNMPALVEVHNETEMETALEAQAAILGINNRDLNDLSIDLKTTERLVRRIPEGLKKSLTLISESGFHKKEDIQDLPKEIDAVLIGTSFMSAQNPQKAIEELILPVGS